MYDQEYHDIILKNEKKAFASIYFQRVMNFRILNNVTRHDIVNVADKVCFDCPIF
jgi:hypothetical protein